MMIKKLKQNFYKVCVNTIHNNNTLITNLKFNSNQNFISSGKTMIKAFSESNQQNKFSLNNSSNVNSKTKINDKASKSNELDIVDLKITDQAVKVSFYY